MPKLRTTLAAWNSANFVKALKSEMENLGAGSLPLDQCVAQGGYVDDSNICVMVLHFGDYGPAIEAKVGIFFTEIVGCCGCPIEPFDESVYCEVAVKIDKSTADAEFWVIPS